MKFKFDPQFISILVGHNIIDIWLPRWVGSLQDFDVLTLNGNIGCSGDHSPRLNFEFVLLGLHVITVELYTDSHK